MKFKEYWFTRDNINYNEMVEAKAAFDFQERILPKWRDANKVIPDPEEQVIAYRTATEEQLSIDREYHPVIFAAIDPDRWGVWYDWEADKDVDTRYFKIEKWMPVSDLLKFM